MREIGRGRFLTVTGVAELAGVSAATVRRWSDRGLLPATRLPSGHRRYNRRDVEVWLQREQIA